MDSAGDAFGQIHYFVSVRFHYLCVCLCEFLNLSTLMVAVGIVYINKSILVVVGILHTCNNPTKFVTYKVISPRDTAHSISCAFKLWSQTLDYSANGNNQSSLHTSYSTILFNSAIQLILFMFNGKIMFCIKQQYH